MQGCACLVRVPGVGHGLHAKRVCLWVARAVHAQVRSAVVVCRMFVLKTCASDVDTVGCHHDVSSLQHCMDCIAWSVGLSPLACSCKVALNHPSPCTVPGNAHNAEAVQTNRGRQEGGHLVCGMRTVTPCKVHAWCMGAWGMSPHHDHW